MGRGSDEKTGVADNSVLTEPVFGNNTGEPCNTHFPTDGCTQAWKWMLDAVIDPDEVVTTYHYTVATNSYRSVGGDLNQSRSYDMGEYLTEVDYGWASQLAGANFTDRVVLGYVNRCTDRMTDPDPLRDAVASCPTIASSPTHYPDVPTDKICGDATGDADGCTGADKSYAPLFFDTDMLWSIKTYTLTTSGAASEVMIYQLKHVFSNPPGAVTDFLWLDYIQREGFSGTGAPIVLPVINFNGTDLENVVGGTNALMFKRVTTIDNDLGGVTTVTYGRPDVCITTALPSESNNLKDCYKQQWTPDGTTTVKTNWFNKYVVTEVDDDPNVGVGAGHDGDPIQTTSYDYSGGKPGWRFPLDPLQQRKDESWTQWRGYSFVVVTEGTSAALKAVAYWIFQGLDGDRTNTAGTSTKTVTVTGSSAGPTLSLSDSAWLADKVYEESDRNSTGSSQRYVVSTFGFVHDTAAYPGLTDARMVAQTATNTYERVSTSSSDVSTWRRGEQQTFYDTGVAASADFDLPVSSEDDGQIGVGDNTCTTYGYAYNIDPATSRWIALPDETKHYTGTCPALGAQDADAVTFYDGATTLATNIPFDGDVTEVDTYTGATAFTSAKHTYDAGGRTLSSTDGNGNVTTMVYTPIAGWPTSTTVTTPIPDVTAQDAYGQSSSKTAFTSITVASAANGQTTAVTDANGEVTTVQYDTAGRLINVWKPKDPTSGPATTKISYTIPTGTVSAIPDSPTGPAKTETDSLQTGTTYLPSVTYLDGLGQTREVQAPAADGSAGRDAVSTRYDSTGNVVGTSNPYYNTGAPGTGMINPAITALPSYTATTVDWAGRITETQLKHLGVAITAGDTQTAYFPDKTTLTDPDGNITTTNLDVFGNASSIVQSTPHLSPTSITTSYGYDDKQQLTTITDVNAAISTHTYNWAGQQTASSDPDAGNTCTYYDSNGNTQYAVASAPATCPASPSTQPQLITTLYDALNRPTSTWSGVAGTGTELSWAGYDTATLGKDKAAVSTSYSGTDAYTTTVDGYDVNGDSLGATVTIPAAEGALAGTYDTKTPSYNSAGAPLTVDYPGVGTGTSTLAAETVTTNYTALGQPSTLTSPLGTYDAGTSYTNWGPVNNRTYGTGTLTASRSYGWDQTTGWLTNIATSVTNNGATTPAQNDTYGYDNAGNTTEVASATGTAQQQCFRR